MLHALTTRWRNVSKCCWCLLMLLLLLLLYFPDGLHKFATKILCYFIFGFGHDMIKNKLNKQTTFVSSSRVAIIFSPHCNNNNIITNKKLRIFRREIKFSIMAQNNKTNDMNKIITNLLLFIASMIFFLPYFFLCVIIIFIIICLKSNE